MQFQRIICRQDGSGPWEIFLESGAGKPIRLSQSGNSLKSVFIILSVILLNSKIQRDSRLEDVAFFVEEPENNLHPSLLRRLLDFLYCFSIEKRVSLLITTHSATAIDWAGRKDDSPLIHVTRYGNKSKAIHVTEYGGTRNLLDDLDVRASELLQSNGIIWVEGPSDRIYLKKWIDLYSDGNFVEGSHYSVMFYGGKLLYHLSCHEPSKDSSFIDLLRLNRNTAVVIDSDRRRLKSGKFRSGLNETKRRIRDEAGKSGAYVWVTQGREIENYIAPRLIKLIRPDVLQPEISDSVPDFLGISDKIQLAQTVAENSKSCDLEFLDLGKKIEELVSNIRRWNGECLS